MRKLTCFLFWVLLSGSTAVLAEIPQVFYIPHFSKELNPYPAFAAAERVLTPSGEVNSALFSLGDRSIISGYLRVPPRDGCIRLAQERILETVGPERTDRQSLADMAKGGAGWVFSARITARAPGFNGSNPGTLLEVVPEEIFKGPRDRGGAHYVFVPIGTFSVGGKKICKTDERYAALPEVGDRVLLFIDLNWLNQGRFLWTGEDSGIITISREGVVSLPKRYMKTEPSLAGGQEENLLRFIRKSIGREN